MRYWLLSAFVSFSFVATPVFQNARHYWDAPLVTKMAIEPRSILWHTSRIFAGLRNTCALSTTGAAMCWGKNEWGQVGDGTTENRWTPVDVVGLVSNVTSIAPGNNHTCALTGTGAVKCWGLNNWGQLGNNTVIDSLVPAEVVGLGSNVVAITSFGNHTCALTSFGAVKCWGHNEYGVLGNNSTVDSRVAVEVVGLGSGVAAISVGLSHSCALTILGTVKCWGGGFVGQMGNAGIADAHTPVDVVGLGGIAISIAAGGNHTCALLSGGGTKCWGYNEFGQIGNASNSNVLTPVDVVGQSTGVSAIASGNNHTCVLNTIGGVKCWGANQGGQLGNSSNTNTNTPVNVFGLGSGVSSVTAGNVTCGTTNSGVVWCWGNNLNGGLGIGPYPGTNVPIEVVALGGTPEATATPTATAIEISTPTRTAVPTGTPAATGTPIPTGGITIAHIEVNQAIQDDNDAVPLVANKATLVRVYVDCTTRCGTTISGNLYVRTSSGAIVPTTALNNSIIAEHPTSWTTQRGSLSKSLNFYVAPEFARGAFTLTATVDYSSMAEKSASFIQVKNVDVLVVPIDYKFSDDFWCPDRVNDANQGFFTAEKWATSLLPTAAINLERHAMISFDRDLLVRSAFFGFCTYEKNHASETMLFNLLKRTALMSTIGTVDTVYGWLPAEAYQGGLSRLGYQMGELVTEKPGVAFGDAGIESNRTFAHELSHTFLRLHTPAPKPAEAQACIGPTQPPTDANWPYQDSKIHTWGVDLSASTPILKDPRATFDLMSYCGKESDSNVWVSPWTYTNTLGELLTRATPASNNRLGAGVLVSVSDYFLVSGLVFSSNITTLDAIYTISKSNYVQSENSLSAYCALSQNAQGMTISEQCFDLADVDPVSGIPIDVSGYALLLPADASVKRIVIRRGAVELISRVLSTNEPAVHITSPIAGSSWGASGTFTISWTGSDLDGDLLTYSVLHSKDGGETWVAISADTTDTQYLVNSGELAGGGQSRIRVMVTDGFSTSAEEVVLAIASKAPEVHILSPSDNSTIGDTAFFSGVSYDIEDKSLTGLSLSWQSDRDGLMGHGTSIAARLSTSGPHTITLSAIDSDGNITSDSIRVFFGNRVFLPQAQR